MRIKICLLNVGLLLLVATALPMLDPQIIKMREQWIAESQARKEGFEKLLKDVKEKPSYNKDVVRQLKKSIKKEERTIQRIRLYIKEDRENSHCAYLASL